MNSWPWLAWLAAVLLAVSATRNPLYLFLILLALMIVFSFYSDPAGEENLAVVSPLKFSILIITLATLFNGLTSHFGATVLFNIPGKIPLISGPVTLEALIFGFINGLALSAMLTAFTIINVALPVSALIRLAPRTFYPLAVVVSIAVTFLPSTRRQIDQIIEAQKIRGQRLVGARDWLPLIMPLLIGGLERSLQLAETMTARGFTSQAGSLNQSQRFQVVAGLLLIFCGWLLVLSPAPVWAGPAFLAAGLLLIGTAFWLLGRQMPRASFRKETWSGRDVLAASACLGVVIMILAAPPALRLSGLAYQPYPQAGLPPFDARFGFLALLLLTPLILKREA